MVFRKLIQTVRKIQNSSKIVTRSKPRRRALLAESLEPRLAMAVFSVSSNADSGAGSLRQAILSANNTPGSDSILFSLPENSRVIQLQNPLPFVTDSVVIDATSQEGFSGLPLVALDGSLITSPIPSGIVVSTSNSAIRGLHIYGFDYGITVMGGSENRIELNALGTDPTGTLQVSNRKLGIYLIDTSNNRIGGSTLLGNLISGNPEAGIRIDGASSQNIIAGNLIGTDLDGATSGGPQQYGVLISSGSANIVGTNGDDVDDDLEGNLISGNIQAGVTISGSSQNIVAGNLIGTDFYGLQGITGQTNGIEVNFGSEDNRVGTNGDGVGDDWERNTISANTEAGIYVFQATTNLIAGNYIGLMIDGITPLGNGNSGIVIDDQSNSNQIGIPGAPNYIADNGAFAVFLRNSSSNRLRSNIIGLGVDQGSILANSVGAIRIRGGSLNTIGGATIAEQNTIAFADTVAIIVDSNSLRNTLTGNSYLGSQNFVIDLNNDGSSVNDEMDPDAGPNGLQNTPVIDAAVMDDQQTLIAGHINTTAYTRVIVEVLAGQSIHPSPLNLIPLQRLEVITDKEGNATWSTSLASSIAPNDYLVALAHVAGSGTSELSNFVSIQGLMSMDLSQPSVAESIGTTQATVHRPAGTDLLSELVVSLNTNDTDRIQIPATVTIPANAESISFDITVVDDQRYSFQDVVIFAESSTASAIAILDIIDNESAWHNYSTPLDVSGNGTITPSDALAIINYLNSGANRVLTQIALQVPPVYYDTFLDGRIAASDALAVINFLNSQTVGEGETSADSDKSFEVDLERMQATFSFFEDYATADLRKSRLGR